MTNRMVAVFTICFAFMAVFQTAEAKRFGGGKSFGYSKSVPNKSFNQAPKQTPAAPKAAPTSKPNAAGAPAKSGASKWLGPLAGLAVGGLLAAMIFGDGFEGLQVMDILIFALIAFLLFKLFMAKKRQASSNYEYADQGQPRHQQTERPVEQPVEPMAEPVQQRQSQPAYDPHAGGSIIGSGLGEAVSESAQPVNEIPEWFNAEQFVDGAKSHFITLQKAWDNADISEIKSYCTPELFADIEQMMQSMQPGDNHTVVDTLDCEIATMAVDGNDFVVSLRFSGFIKESMEEEAHAFTEIWHIKRDASDQGDWMVAGIQQLS